LKILYVFDLERYSNGSSSRLASTLHKLNLSPVLEVDCFSGGTHHNQYTDK
jgi:hypothetical protein